MSRRLNPAKRLTKRQGVLLRNQPTDEKGRPLSEPRIDLVLVDLDELGTALKYLRSVAYPDYDRLGEAVLGFLRIGARPGCKVHGDPDVWTVMAAVAERGWGPALYDLGLEAAELRGAWLSADRRTITEPAERIWKHYAAKRDDVDKAKLKGLLCPQYGRYAAVDYAFRPGSGFKPRLEEAEDRLGAVIDPLPASDERGLQYDLDKAGWTLFEKTYAKDYRDTPRRDTTTRSLAILAAAAAGVAAIMVGPMANPRNVSRLKRRLL